MGSRTRWASAGLVAGLLAVVGSLPLAAAPPAEAAPAAATATERASIDDFYAAHGFSSPAGRPAAARTAAAGTAQAADTYFDDFYRSYAESPGVQVRSLAVESTVLRKAVLADRIEYTVSVSVEFGLYDEEARQAFTGGEQVDHLLTVSRSAGATTAGTAEQAMTVLSDRSLGVSTAPQRQVADPAAIPRVDPRYVVPAAQLAKKKAVASRANRAAGGVSAAASNPFPRLDYQAMVDYAATWTDSRHEDVINTDPYPKLDANNCTNFVSQSLHHGGWKIRDTTYPFRKKVKYWDYNMTGPGTFTYTWTVAQSNYDRLAGEAGLTKFSTMEDAWLADIVYFDWNVQGSTFGGALDHAMVTTRVVKGKPYFSQKSGNRHNVPVSQVKKNIKDGGGTKYTVYGLRT